MPDATRLVVIGAGPGGYTAAFHAADLGMRVTLIDESARLGGVCLQRGCIPSKALLHAAGVIGDARRAARWGVAFGAPAVDLDRLRGWKDEVVSALTGGLGRLARQRAVTFLQGRAAFADPHNVMVEPAGGGEPTSMPFDYAIVATGSRPVLVTVTRTSRGASEPAGMIAISGVIETASRGTTCSSIRFSPVKMSST